MFTDYLITIALYFVVFGGLFACYMCYDLLKAGLMGRIKLK